MSKEFYIALKFNVIQQSLAWDFPFPSNSSPYAANGAGECKDDARISRPPRYWREKASLS